MKTQRRRAGYALTLAIVSAAFMLAAAGTSEAAKKKATAKPAAPPAQAIVCFNAGAPVCATKGGAKFTYANSCYAMKDGAKITSSSACKSAKMASAAKKKKK
ncbi:MAG TPA: hypothetical protein VFS63_13915 [Pseudolabrys sp.]|jgi:hypothetical protein|nr:hypothetical protein [Pseudolabrys sp.]